MIRTQMEFVADVATAVKWRVEQMVEAGAPFHQAKRDAIKQAEPSWRHLTYETQQAVRDVCWSITPADLSKRTHLAVKDQFRCAIEKHRGRPLGAIDRLLFRWFGLIWR